jgi:ferric-dicitrate binding protein FerR (iron transport regulator)
MNDIGTAQNVVEILSRPVPPSDAEATAIINWMAASPKNVSLYVDVSLLDSALRAAGLAERGIGEQWIASAPDARRTARWYALSGSSRLAASLLIVSLLLGLLWLSMREPWTTYVTGPGVARQVELDPASTMRIFGGSSLRVRNSSSGVEIHVADGGATFRTRAGVTHSFAVEVTGGRVEALPPPETDTAANFALSPAAPMLTTLIADTQDAGDVEFNVLRKGEETGVSVTEGRVQVTGDAQHDPVILSVGESTAISVQGHVSPGQRMQESRLLIASSSLAQLAQLFNSRNTVPQLQVIGRARLHPVGGLVRIDNPAKLVLALQALGDFTIEPHGNTVVIRLKDDPVY